LKKPIIILMIIFVQIFSTHVCHAGLFGGLKKLFSSAKQEMIDKGTIDESTIITALKEAISVGTDNAVKSISLDGYLKNKAIKIVIPENLRMVADGLRKIGYSEPVDDFILSMNRAAEQAAPEAKVIFIDAIKEMTFDDAKKILNGNETAVTDYFKIKAGDKLYDAFSPIISSSVNEVGATRYYKTMTDKFALLPFMKMKKTLTSIIT